MLLYPAIFTPDNKYIVVTFPDVPEAITQGKNIQEAYEMAVEVLGFALEDYKEYPQASSVSDLKEQYPNADVALIGIDMLAYMRKYHSKKIRKNVTIPEYLNNLAEDKNLNFSQVLTEALELKLNA
ncbi:phage protein [Streptococcus acidominimus]|uniref:Phage protein n=1 Tax=Streptococcus acidominimus TaxID=1326 RepID=A0A239X0X2_STRAI|nr:type II toxin-antitoxin system HicB family antitoxin [Streptococcus acidominimus]SNV39843.1 phage protein [Streptococcus acidominimus]